MRSILTTNYQLLDDLEPFVLDGGLILDWHTCEIFPERWADLVVVLRCDHAKIWDRLEKRFVFTGFTFCCNKEPRRGYSLKKIQENNEAEIMQIVLEEARGSYPAEIIVELQSESMEQLEANVARIVEWITLWLKNQGGS